MSETPIYDRAVEALEDLDRLSVSGVSGQELRTRAVVSAILAVAEALHARDTLAGSTDEEAT